MSIYSIDKLMSEARRLAREYRTATGKTLPITGEIAVNDAIRVLGMEPATDTDLGYDAILQRRGENLRVQIKGRAILNAARGGHRLGQLKPEREWDGILLVLMDDEYESREIYLAERESVIEAIAANSNKRGSLSIARFRNIGELVWTAENGIEKDGIWSNH